METKYSEIDEYCKAHKVIENCFGFWSHICVNAKLTRSVKHVEI